MCVSHVKKRLIALEDRTFFKVVVRKGGGYVGSMKPHYRSPQGGIFGGGIGTIKLYRIGDTTYADKGSPGIYLYASIEMAQKSCCYYGSLIKGQYVGARIIRCTIPAGSWYRRAGKGRYVLAEKVFCEEFIS